MKKLFNVAIIGGGINSAVGSAHFNALNLSNKFNIYTGVFSRNQSVNIKTANEYNIPLSKVYNSLSELIDKEKNNIDCIIILTPTNQHFKQVLECLNEKIPVICEKALVSNLEEINIIKNVVDSNKLFLSVIYNYLGYPILRELKQIIENGNLGHINQVQIEMPQEGFLRLINGKPQIPQEWRLHDEKISVLSLDLGVHLHMLIKYLTNQNPIKVLAHCQSLGNFSNVIDNINCIIKYTNNLICNMWYSKVAIGKRNGLFIRIYGNKGSAEWYQEDAEYIKMANNNGHKWTIDRGSENITIANQNRYNRFKVGHPAGFIEALANYYVDIANDLEIYYKNEHHMIKQSFGVNDALEGILLFDKIEESNNAESWVELKY